jgi:hypothetical protein
LALFFFFLPLPPLFWSASALATPNAPSKPAPAAANCWNAARRGVESASERAS